MHIDTSSQNTIHKGSFTLSVCICVCICDQKVPLISIGLLILSSGKQLQMLSVNAP